MGFAAGILNHTQANIYTWQHDAMKIKIIPDYKYISWFQHVIASDFKFLAER